MHSARGLADGGENLVFIVGAPRSGTTWLQRLMGAHPEAVTTQETALLDTYVAPLLKAWSHQLPGDADTWQRQRHRGLPSVLTEAEFVEELEAFASAVYMKALKLKPGARVVVDKNPTHALHTDLIRRLFPKAAVLHIVRDGRDVTSSLVAASKDWGREWAPSEITMAAHRWKTYVEAAMSAEASGRYRQVRYEDLLRDPAAGLQACFDFAELPVTTSQCEQLVGRYGRSDTGAESILWSGEVMRRLGRAPTEPEGFFGAGAKQRWPQAWETKDRLAFDVVAGELLQRLGYVPDREWTGATAADRMRAATAYRWKGHVGKFGWWLHMVLGRRGWYVHVARIQPYR